MEDVFEEYEGRRNGIIAALTSGLSKLLEESKDILVNTPFLERKCLWGLPDGNWKTEYAQYQAVEQIPQPQPLIPFDKQWDEWVTRMADLSDAWLVSLAYYRSSSLTLNERKSLVERIRKLPSLKTAICPACPLALLELNEEPLEFRPEYLGRKSAPVFLYEEKEVTYIIMIKPDGVQRGLVGEIISRFEKKGFFMKGLKLFQCPKELAEEHYKYLKKTPSFPRLVSYITSGPVICMAWEGACVVASARKLIGADNPIQAKPGTIRGDLAVETARNLVHGSDSRDNGKHEVALWFKEGELAEWESVQTTQA